MKTIYDFAAHTPPRLTAEKLLALQEARRLRRQTRLLYLCAAASQALLLLLASILAGKFPALAGLLAGYGLLSCAGCMAVAAHSARKEAT